MDEITGYEEKPTIDLLPPLKPKCLMLVRLLHVLFLFVPILLGIWFADLFGWFYGLLLWIAAVFAAMIILSKLKLAYIPFNQHELSHSTAAILKWYVYREFCGDGSTGS
ncbi:hypothetical protein [Hydrogenimonas urashimensis]|uniref:hypothetical protein n=1 Tax=Hydrogenimonas urashimensis TaxID=2740515 RepID=UPI001915103C|nr:hypothetical protein [Hydrogenimonas urashimensis]